MTVYFPLGCERYELMLPEDSEDHETIRKLINGVSRKEHWVPLRMRLLQIDEGIALRESDAPWLGASYALIFKQKAINALRTLLQQFGELLPLACTDAEVSIYNPTSVITQALDESASTILRFANGRPMHISRYVFRESAIQGIDIFKISNLQVSPTFVSNRFVDLWKANGLKGFDFHLVWNGNGGKDQS
jgi:hypothetical protein